MRVVVEFNGISRVLTGVQRYEADFSVDATFRDVLRSLTTVYPALVGEVLNAAGELIASNRLNLNGKFMLRPEQMDNTPADNDCLILMSVLAGG